MSIRFGLGRTAAAGIGILLGSVPASAVIVYTQLHAVVEVPTGGGEVETNVDLDGDGLSDVDFFTNQNGSNARGASGGGSSSSRILGVVQDDGGPSFQTVRNLGPATPISDALVQGDGSEIGDVVFASGNVAILFKSTFGGPQEYLDGAEGFLAAKFNIPGAGTTRFGWVRVQVEVAGVRIGIPPNDSPGSRLRLLDAAYEDEAGTAIPAGTRKGDTPTPFMVRQVSDPLILLGFGSETGKHYALEWSANLVSPDWNRSEFTVAGDGSRLTVYEPAGEAAGRSYRLVGSEDPAGPAPTPRIFVDRTGQLFPGGPANGPATWADYNRDGYPDLFARDQVWRNDGGTGFVLAASITGGPWGDVQNDGYPDLFSFSAEAVHWNNSGAGFTRVQLPTLPMGDSRGSCWGDFNGDGFADLYVGGYEVWPSVTYPDAVLTNQAGGDFAIDWVQPSPWRARGVTACDFDEDGDLDVYVSNYRLQPNLLWRNDGAGNFTDVAATFGVAGDPGGDYPYGHTIGSAWGDLDNDGHIDLFVGNFRHNWDDGSQDHAKFYRNLGPAGSWHFALMGELRGADWQESYASPALADYDNDGDLDLYLTAVNGGDHAVLYRNDGAWRFTDVTDAAGLNGLVDTTQAAWADFDRDGDLDLITDGKLLANTGGDGHWLEVRLRSALPAVNALAIGAQVRVHAMGGVLTRQVEAGTGEGNQNAFVLHFGLAEFNQPVTVDIAWPDGTSQQLANVAVDQLIEVTYGSP